VAGLQKILLVEDDQAIREMYQAFLTKRGYNVKTANDGNQALTAAQEFKPDLVFLDIMMPERDGIEVLHLLRHDETYNCVHSKIVMLTNLGDADKFSDEIHSDAADGYVIKAEISLDDLIEIIHSLETPA
jgi:DNA-binding response OmpR family regulator